MLSIHGCDPHFYLTPFLDFPEFRNAGEPIAYPPINTFEILHPSIAYNQEEYIAGIVELAKSQHTRGLPFQRVAFYMEKLPDGMAES